MKAFVFIETDEIGEVILEVIDESMGGVGGELIAYAEYKKYREKIQQQCSIKSISNSTDFNYKIVLSNGTNIIAQGGIGITDFENFHEKYIEIAGVDVNIIKKVKKA